MSTPTGTPATSLPASPGGRGIPRLQELSFLEVAILGVAGGATFEEIRHQLVAHMIELRRNNAGTGNIATFRLAQDDPKRYVRNATESLKELMRLGLVTPATLPSSARAARTYKNTTFGLTAAGQGWAALLEDDLRGAYDELLGMLWKTHPQFEGFLRAVSVDRAGLVVPLAQWGELPLPRTRDRYVDFLTKRVAEALSNGESGWSATESDVRTAITTYIESIRQSAEDRERPDPHPRNQDFVRGCEEAVCEVRVSSMPHLPGLHQPRGPSPLDQGSRRCKLLVSRSRTDGSTHLANGRAGPERRHGFGPPSDRK